MIFTFGDYAKRLIEMEEKDHVDVMMENLQRAFPKLKVP